jgi:hypothetical protein
MISLIHEGLVQRQVLTFGVRVVAELARVWIFPSEPKSWRFGYPNLSVEHALRPEDVGWPGCGALDFVSENARLSFLTTRPSRPHPL